MTLPDSRFWIDTLEAMVFAAPEPVCLKDITQALQRAYDGVDMQNLSTTQQDVLREPALLAPFWDALWLKWQEPERQGGFELVRLGDKLFFRSCALAHKAIQSLLGQKPPKLSRAALETVAIVAYRQPITKSDIDHIRGVDSSASLKALLERELIVPVGKKEEVGRASLYGTTEAFLQFFQLPSLGELPNLQEFARIQQAAGSEPEVDASTQRLKDWAFAHPEQIVQETETTALDAAVATLNQTLSATQARLKDLQHEEQESLALSEKAG
jgi:segregation and condensation protein B